MKNTEEIFNVALILESSWHIKEAILTGKISNQGKRVLNYTESRISNGIIEGINAKIQLAKKRARGYRKTANFINRVYFILW